MKKAMSSKKKGQVITPEEKLIEELNKKIVALEEQIVSLETEKKDQDEMVKRAQYDYINLKMDFDRYQKKHESDQTIQKRELQIASVKKFLPFVETMRKSLAALDEEQQKTKLAE
jgi:multidrug resistance efflux pump